MSAETLAVRSAWRRAITGTQRADRARDLAAFNRITDAEQQRQIDASTAAETAARNRYEQEQADLRHAGQVLAEARRHVDWLDSVADLRNRNRRHPRPWPQLTDAQAEQFIAVGAPLIGAALDPGDTP